MKPVNFIVFMTRLSQTYQDCCAPICRELQINRTAFDILLFLANHPEYHTAGEISRYRGIKANLVSFTVNKLVEDGYLARSLVPGDRRKINLSCTKKAKPIIARGQAMQDWFGHTILAGLTHEDVDRLSAYFTTIEKNISRLKQAEKESKKTS